MDPGPNKVAVGNEKVASAALINEKSRASTDPVQDRNAPCYAGAVEPGASFWIAALPRRFSLNLLCTLACFRHLFGGDYVEYFFR